MTSNEIEQAEVIPEVTEQDIRELEQRWRLAFDEPRRQILRSNESFDVEACPGSGKTTLLVAKLAILARKWPHGHRGICVLSHTNVARQEVETRLAGTSAGQRLLAAPHFVGTIHGFVNQFLALPMLRSEGEEVRLIDDESCGDFCRNLLHHDRSYMTAQQFLANKEARSPDRTICALRYEGAFLALGSAAGNMPCKSASRSHEQLTKIKRRASEKGLWRHDDMFAWACKLLWLNSGVVECVRWRFPAVFIDEMQDTSEMQNEILSQVFPRAMCALRQRFGDSNQAIYDFGECGATTDSFPRGDIRKLTNSKRFGPQIAAKAAPLAPVTLDPGLIGEGPQTGEISDTEPTAIGHTIFCFGANAIEQVLPAFGKLLLDTFQVSLLESDEFVARAIGRVGMLKEDDGRTARSIPDYWAGYESRSARLEPRPERLVGFLHLAQRVNSRTGDCFKSAHTVAGGIIELIRRVGSVDTSRTVRSMKWLREAIEADASALLDLQRCLWCWCVEVVPLCEEEWPKAVRSLRRALRPLIHESWPSDAKEFCEWSVEFAGDVPGGVRKTTCALNQYVHSGGDRTVEISVGTIHSAKGQTHTATLVLETLFRKYDMADLLPWVSGYGNKPKKGKERDERRRLIYTAMTRPTHLLCLAIRKEALASGGDGKAHVASLRERGWKVREL